MLIIITGESFRGPSKRSTISNESYQHQKLATFSQIR